MHRLIESTPATPSAATDPGHGAPPAAPIAMPSEAEHLRAVLALAAMLDPGHGDGWRFLRTAAIAATGRLAETGLVPAHLVVRPDDPTPVVLRTLVAASHRLEARTRGDGRGDPARGGSPTGRAVAICSTG